MPKCNKVPNPCKICLRKVTERTGLQCEGACNTWIHFECLNYTPGKINDIKRGIIKVSCPCPDCKSLLPKECRTDEPFSCSNTKCPANLPPQCENIDCPTGRYARESPIDMGCALGSCGTGCKQNSLPHRVDPVPIEPCSPRRLDYTGLSSCSSNRDIPGDYDRPRPYRHSPPQCRDDPFPVDQICSAVGQLTGQITELMHKMREVLPHPPQHQGCSSNRDRSQCQPCYCPGNPCNK